MPKKATKKPDPKQAPSFEESKQSIQQILKTSKQSESFRRYIKRDKEWLAHRCVQFGKELRKAQDDHKKVKELGYALIDLQGACSRLKAEKIEFKKCRDLFMNAIGREASEEITWPELARLAKHGLSVRNLIHKVDVDVLAATAIQTQLQNAREKICQSAKSGRSSCFIESASESCAKALRAEGLTVELRKNPAVAFSPLQLFVQWLPEFGS